MVVLQLTAELIHSIDLIFASSYIKCILAVALSEGLVLNEAAQNLIHRNFSLEMVVGSSNTFDNMLTKVVLVMTIPVSMLNCSVILESSTG